MQDIYSLFAKPVSEYACQVKNNFLPEETYVDALELSSLSGLV